MYDIIIIGAGFSGAICASVFARECDKKVLVLEKRSHIGGNMYEKVMENGVRVHLYGPHIFHTNSERAFSYIKPYSEWTNYEHRVLAKINGELVPVPFNFTSLEQLLPSDKVIIIKEKLADVYQGKEKVTVLELMESEDPIISEFGKFVFDNVFVNYTSKQWGIPATQVDKAVLSRVPVVLGYDNRYFIDEIQKMPKDGFTVLFENLLNHPNITVETNCDALNHLKLNYIDEKIYFNGEEFNGKIIYSGEVDALCNYEFGALPYRSLNLVFECYHKKFYQPIGVVNYPNEEEFTRITEFKYLTQQHLDTDTVILKEYPVEYSVDGNTPPYYPISNQNNDDIYKKYAKRLKVFKNLHLCGRLAQYKYYNMDGVIEEALMLCSKIRGEVI